MAKIIINQVFLIMEIVENDKSDIETESGCSNTSEISSYISEENDELTDNDKESEMTDINDGTVNSILLICNFDSNNK
jgi:hypothetical protein